ncbi:SDR family NAD(P)-dependent oxidoreductase, partial [Streptomyces sp. NPDC048142]|uniref:SDR family NAD(P)-dependent oxidoreductase n=1 Tax=Streptomyces sp. NPDC048142 TaxID=3365501 RepID=UPI003713234F
TPLNVSHAFHSPHMNPILEKLHHTATHLTYHESRIKAVSTVSGTAVTAREWSSPEYWVEQVRRPVRFLDAVRSLETAGVTAFVELGPDGVCTSMATQGVTDPDGKLAVPLLRRGKPEASTLLTALASLFVRGAAVDWSAYFAGTRAWPVPLPTYAFDRERYWLQPSAGTTGTAPSTGGHPLLGAPVRLAGSADTVFTRRVPPLGHPMPAPHEVLGAAVLPAAAIVELALRAGDEIGRPGLAELSMHEPLVLPAEGGLELQVRAGAPDDGGPAALSVHTRPEADPEAPWTLHAQGLFLPVGAAGVSRDAEPSATPGEDTLVRLPEGLADEVASYGIHPHLLDEALAGHAVGAGADGAVSVPAEWRGVRLHATGATAVHARITGLDSGAVALTLLDATGAPVVTADSIAYRDIPVERFRTVSDDPGEAVFEVGWIPVAGPDDAPSLRWAVLGSGAEVLSGPEDLGDAERFSDVDAVAGSADRVDAVAVLWSVDHSTRTDTSAHDGTARALDVLRAWLADERLRQTPLVVVTRGAVAALDAEAPDPAGAALWGLVRSARSEHPGRIVLVDCEGQVSQRELSAVLAGGEHEVALRRGTVFGPRLRRIPPVSTSGRVPWAAEGTVLVTGGTGALGADLSRHLVAEHGARRLLLLDLPGEQSAQADELAAELTRLGAEVTMTSCDVADRGALAALLADLPQDRPLSAVVHAAGALDNGLIETLTPERLHTVLRPKVDGAWNLHELTRDMDLRAFVLCSSTVGVFGGPGQSNYAAANAFLDALAQHRRAQHRPGLSIAWGLWEPAGGGAGPAAKELERFVRSGFLPTPRAQGLALFDRALAADTAALVATPVSLGHIRAGDRVPPLLRTLAGGGATRRAARTAAPAQESPAESVAAMSPADRKQWALLLVREELASVLGHLSGAAVVPDRPFQELGLDSLTGVELRDRLNAATGIRLPATMVFDHPTPGALAAYVEERLTAHAGSADDAAALAELDRLEATLTTRLRGEAARTEITARLRSLMEKLNAPHAAPEAPEAPEAGEALTSASADDLFRFIDSQLGRSAG